MRTITVLVFAKYPTPGTVNTRMVPPLTVEQAALLHTASLRTVWESVTALDTVNAKLLVTPDERINDLRELAGVAPQDCWPQGDGDFGERLTRATARALSVNPDGVMAVGADSPTLPQAMLREALAALAAHDAVLGPCEDGGYYLLGMRKHLPILFERIDWGSPQVAQQTRTRAATAGIELAELSPWYDLDRSEDLRRAGRDLREMTDTDRPAMIALGQLIASYTSA
jgi:hypothetical protein